MQSQIIALLLPHRSCLASMLVRRANGQFVVQNVDSRIAHAQGEAANRLKSARAIVDPVSREVAVYEMEALSPV
jgi:hypothetical protein